MTTRSQTCQFQLKFGTKTSSNTHNSKVVFTFSLVLRKLAFFGKFGSKNHNCHFQLKFSSKNYSNIPNSMVVLTFSVLDGKHCFLANLVQNISIVSFSWYLAPSLIGISEIQGWFSLFQFYTGNTLFGKILSKNALLID